MTETVAATPIETRDTKLEIIMGREALDKLANATVLVLGCGGVGSNCCEALARGGIGHFVILDKDVIAPSNINRQDQRDAGTRQQRKAEHSGHRAHGRPAGFGGGGSAHREPANLHRSRAARQRILHWVCKPRLAQPPLGEFDFFS